MELMVSIGLLVLLVGFGVYSFGKATKQSTASTGSVKSREVAEDLGRRMKSDIARAVFINGNAANTLGFFEGSSRTYGILRFPFAAPYPPESSDGIQIFTIDDSNSMASFFTASEIIGVDRLTLRVLGDFRPKTTTPEDTFVMTNGAKTELFKINGTVSYSGSNPGFSTFALNAAVPSDFNIDGIDNPIVYRVRRIIYQVQSSPEGQGLYRSTTGTSTSHFHMDTKGVTHMEIKYSTQSLKGETNQTDCGTKNDERFFPHDSNPTECNWNDIRAVKIDIQLDGQEISWTQVPSNYRVFND